MSHSTAPTHETTSTTATTTTCTASTHPQFGSSPQQTIRRRCLCEPLADPDDNRLPWDFSVLCSTCCKRALKPQIERHEHALLKRDLARQECAETLEKLKANTNIDSEGNDYDGTSISELEFQSQQLRDRRQKLQQQCAAMAVEVAGMAVANEERRLALNPHAEFQRHQLHRLELAVGEGSMKQSIAQAKEQVRSLRFQWALKAFAMHRLDVRQQQDDSNLYHHHAKVDDDNTPNSKGKQRRSSRRLSSHHKEGQAPPKQARGIGKIGGLPLPHAGPDLYGVLPPQELQSALRLVASVCSSVSRCLGIVLPHPVLLQFHSTTTNAAGSDSHHQQHQQGDIIHSILKFPPTAQEQGSTANKSKKEDAADPTSMESLLALLNTPLHEDTDSQQQKLHNQALQERTSSTMVQPSMDPAMVAQRLRHATSAVLADSSSADATQYALSADVMHQDEFPIALQLLQNNIIVLCIRAGVPVGKLWPGEAVLLNLHALQVFCEDQVKDYLKE